MAFVIIPTNLKKMVDHLNQLIEPIVDQSKLESLITVAKKHNDTVVVLESNCFLGLLYRECKNIHLVGHHHLDVNNVRSAAQFADYLIRFCGLPIETRTIKFEASDFTGGDSDALRRYLQEFAACLADNDYHPQVKCGNEVINAKHDDEQMNVLTSTIGLLASDITISKSQQSLASLFKSAASSQSTDEEDDIAEEFFISSSSKMH